MKIEKRNGSYRVQKMIDGKRYSITYDHKPTEREVMRDLLKLSDAIPAKGSFLACAKSYIKSKDNVISPSTIKGYTSILNALPDDFKHMEISNITQIDIQTVINDYSADHSPKTTRNVHGFISAVLRQFRPDMVIYTTLPQKSVYEPYTPSEDDIKRILDACVNEPFYHIPFQLGIMGLRRSEVCALTLDDIRGNTLSINKALVKDVNNKWIVKKTKTTAGTREIYIPDSLVSEIEQYGKIFDGNPTTLLYGLNKYQDKLGIPRFRFHDLRHFMASYAHSKGMSDADIMSTGGWKSDYTMKSIYRHEMNAKAAQKQVFDDIILGAIPGAILNN